MLRTVLFLLALLCPSLLLGQSLQLRVLGGGPPALAPRDTVPLEIIGYDASGRRVLVDPAKSELIVKPPCAGYREVQRYGTARRLIIWAQETCDIATVPIEVIAEWDTPTGWKRATIKITSPQFSAGSNQALCLASYPESMKFTSRDTTLALAIQARDQRIALLGLTKDPLGPHPFPGAAVVTYQYFAIRCMPGYKASDVTRSSYTKWATSDSSIIVVDRYGKATWKDGGSYVIGAQYRAP